MPAKLTSRSVKVADYLWEKAERKAKNLDISMNLVIKNSLKKFVFEDELNEKDTEVIKNPPKEVDDAMNSLIETAKSTFG